MLLAPCRYTQQVVDWKAAWCAAIGLLWCYEISATRVFSPAVTLQLYDHSSQLQWQLNVTHSHKVRLTICEFCMLYVFVYCILYTFSLSFRLLFNCSKNQKNLVFETCHRPFMTLPPDPVDGHSISAPPCPYKLQPEYQGKLVWIAGTPGSGKSTLAQLMAREKGED